MKSQINILILSCVALFFLSSHVIVIRSYHTDNDYDDHLYATGSSPLYTSDYISRFNHEDIRKLFSLFTDVKCSYGSTTTKNSKHMIQPVNQRNFSDNFEDRVEFHCKPGTVQIGNWLRYALRTQYELSYSEPINIVQHLATHNSFNARANGYGMGDHLIRKVLNFFRIKSTEMVIAQQEYSMTDQLNMGVRLLQLDSHWFFNRLTLCHAGNNVQWFNELVERLKKELGITIEFDSNQIGCLPTDRSWREGLKEIAQWIESNKNQVIFLFINDHERWDHGHTDQVLEPLKEYFGHLLFTPIDLQDFRSAKAQREQWPSTKDLVHMNKRVILLGTDYLIERDARWGLLFPVNMIPPGYPQNTMNKYLGYPTCLDRVTNSTGQRYDFDRDWLMIGGQSVVYGPFYNGPKEEGIIVPSNVQNLVDCGVKFISLDQASPLLISSSIWTWARDHPQQSASHKCVYVSSRDENSDEIYHGTWFSAQCDLRLNYACQSNESPSKWWISDNEISMTTEIKCPAGYSFKAPTLAFYNKKLREQMKRQNVPYVWINHQIA